ncbi:MAG: domain containing protein [Myxococcales bacterium]|nr:domain containing protein [Myxococcales bacterium]
MAICDTCGRDNQNLYKFCLGCGAELNAGPAVADAGDTLRSDPTPYPKRVEEPSASHSNGDIDDYDLRDRRDSLAHIQPIPGLAPSLQEAANASRPSSARLCPSCGNVVPSEFAFCGACGSRLEAQRHVDTTRNELTPSSDSHGSTAGQLVLIRPDGTEGGVHPLAEGENVIGRGLGSLFDADGYLSPRHAELVLNAAGLVVRDTGSLNGVFVKLVGEEELHDGDVFRIGQELLRFDEIQQPVPLDDGTDVMGSPNPGYWGRLALIVGRDQDGSAFPLFGDSVTLGRERGDILFPEDGYVSGQHARVELRDGRFYLCDLDSSNGTFVRVRGERAVKAGGSILMGQQLFRISY